MGAWRHLERDLHDGVQNELVALLVKLALVEQDSHTPPAHARILAELEARAQAALDSLRDSVHGIYPPALADFGVEAALRAQAARAAIDVSLGGTAPRSAGLRNIRDRVQDLGGTISVASNPGQGTVLLIILPWPPPAGATP